MALKIRHKTPCAISTTIGGSMYEYSWYQRGLERWFIDMLENPAFCEVLLDKMLGFWKDYYIGYMSEVGDLVDVVQIGDDVAGQDGPMFSPQFYRSVVKPRLKELIKHIKSLTAAKIWYHTCGGCTELLPDLIECGIDILNPVQISAKGMNPEVLKERFGDKLVLWGGACDTQHFLPFASPQQVAEHVRKNLEIFKPGGGYVFNNVHNIQADVPVENIIAMFDTAYEYGFY
jgi:uroporphyrinogen decarboxylase